LSDLANKNLRFNGRSMMAKVAARSINELTGDIFAFIRRKKDESSGRCRLGSNWWLPEYRGGQRGIRTLEKLGGGLREDTIYADTILLFNS